MREFSNELAFRINEESVTLSVLTYDHFRISSPVKDNQFLFPKQKLPATILLPSSWCYFISIHVIPTLPRFPALHMHHFLNIL